MSAQKLVAEADRLLERGKYPEAIEKLKSAISADPLNQLIATKLANAFVETEDLVSAKKVLVGAANRLSEAGKSQVAIAIYKQAIELAPNDIELRTKFAIECESVGKVGDAVNSAQMVLKHYLQRKKYFDAANILPLIVRNQNKDEKMKFVWVEVMQLSQADQKLIHLLVALAGPPGLVSQEFQVGGEPAAMSEALYQAFKSLVDWFPNDAKIAYAVAWCAQKKGNEREFFFYLRECLRREPDFCLGLLLFARVLAEKQKLTEALFVYKYLRERLGSDRTVDMLTLTRLVEGFVEKNGWISFTEGMMSSGEYSSKDFVKAFMAVPEVAQESVPAAATSAAPNIPIPNSIPAPPAMAAANIPKPSVPVKKEESASEDIRLPPSEIELSPPISSEATSSSMEIQLTSGEKLVKKAQTEENFETYNPDATKIAKPMPQGMAELIPSAEATVATVQVQSEKSYVAPPEEAKPAETLLTKEVPELQATNQIKEKAKSGYNPLASLQEAKKIEEEAPQEDLGAKTILFSPMEAVQATSQKRSNFDEPKTQIMEESNDATMIISRPPPVATPPPVVQEEAHLPEPEQPTNITNNLHHAAILESAATVLYDPVEAVEAGLNSRRGAANAADEIAQEPQVSAEPDQVVQPVEEEAQQPAVNADQKNEGQQGFGGAFVPIPQMQEIPAATSKDAPAPAMIADGVDLGDDLLDGPTRILTNIERKDATAHLLKEIQEDAKAVEESLNPAVLLKKAERYIAKRNYYLARKAVRHALALGADETVIKEKLREIRRLEMPESLYAAVSTDLAKDEGSKNLLEKLEEEFDLKTDDSAEEISLLKKSIKLNFEEIFKDSDARTIMDFGVGLHEMGLYKEAESFFIRMVSDHPEQSFDAYYLAAISKFARKDYAGAVSILKKLSLDSGRSDRDKISIYYTLGEVFEKMQQGARSKSFYEKVAALDANYRNIRDKLEK